MRPTVVGGAGARLHLADGREVLDFSSLAECCNLGHQHPKLVAAIRAQAQQLCFVTSSWGAAPRAELAQRLLELSGFEGGRVFFTVGGADANEQAVKIARLAARKPRGLRHRPRPFVPRRHPHGDGALGRQPHPGAGRCARPGRAPRAAALRLSLPLRQPQRIRVRRARGGGGPRLHRRGRRRGRGRGADGTQRRHQRHRGTVELLAGAALACGGAGRLPHRRRGHERLRPLRRVVRLAAPRRGRAPGPHDPGQGPHRRVGAAGRGGGLGRGCRAHRAPDAVHRAHLLRPPAGLRGRPRRDRGLSQREPDRALARAGCLDVHRVARAGAAPCGDRRGARRRRPVRGARAGARPRHARADRAVAAAGAGTARLAGRCHGAGRLLRRPRQPAAAGAAAGDRRAGLADALALLDTLLARHFPDSRSG